jgi:hypothetical protein
MYGRIDFIRWLVDLSSISGLINESVQVCRNEEACRNYGKLLEVLKTVEYGMYSQRNKTVQFLNSGLLKYVVIMYNILLLIPLIISSKKQIFFKLKITDLRQVYLKKVCMYLPC